MPLAVEPKRFPGLDKVSQPKPQAQIDELQKTWKGEFVDRLGMANWQAEGAVRDLILSSSAGLAMMATGMQFYPHPHALKINEYLWQVGAGNIKRLIIEAPPQHGKSTNASHYFPAWHLGMFPDQEIILASYETKFARMWGRRARDVMETFGEEFFDVRVDPASRSAESWKLKHHNGAMHCAGAGGPITGKGCHLAIIDDPFKNDKEANSQLIRDSKWEWYKATLFTRVREGGAIVLINTRWHMDDLAGRLQEQEDPTGDRWVTLTLPALAYDPAFMTPEQLAGYEDPLGRMPGEPLCPGLFSLANLMAKKASVGEYWWNALFQQRPIALEGGLFKQRWLRTWNDWDELPAKMAFVHEDWGPHDLELPFPVAHGSWRYVDANPETQWDQVLISVDSALSKDTKSKRNSYIVMQVWGAKGSRRYLLDQVRFQGVQFVKLALLNLCRKWPMANTKLIEMKANGPEVVADFESWTPGITPILPEDGGSKEGRANSTTWQFEAGNVYIPHRRIYDWVPEFISELCSFPLGAHDDQVDACTQALFHMAPRALMGQPGALVTPQAAHWATWMRRLGMGRR